MWISMILLIVGVLAVHFLIYRRHGSHVSHGGHGRLGGHRDGCGGGGHRRDHADAEEAGAAHGGPAHRNR